jgi:cardiolipin synthase
VNLPNLITVARLFAIPAAIFAIVHREMALAFWVFVAAGVSDAVDGALARAFRAQTDFGRLLDPVADKALLVSVYAAMAYMQYVPLWLVALVVGRDLLIVGGFGILRFLGIRVRIQPLLIGKLNTFAQILLAATVLASEAFDWGWHGMVAALIWLVAATTIGSGAVYVVQGWRAFSQRKAP